MTITSTPTRHDTHDTRLAGQRDSISWFFEVIKRKTRSQRVAKKEELKDGKQWYTRWRRVAFGWAAAW
jgi:hypothetical protein